jgi:hypothetical protein
LGGSAHDHFQRGSGLFRESERHSAKDPLVNLVG